MKILLLLFYIISFSTGLVSISAAILLYIKHQNKIIKYFLIFLIAMLIELIYFILKDNTGYIYFNIEYFLKTIYILGFSVFLVSFPFFIHQLLSIQLSLQKKLFFLLISLIIIIIYILYIILKFQFNIVYIVTNIFFISTMFYCFILSVLNIKNIADKTLKKILLVFLIMYIVFFPLIIFDVMVKSITISLPLYFFTINILSILFSFLYLNQPPFIENNQLTEYFIKKYKITEREKEIILLMKTGYSNYDIGDKLFISLHTVENHIYNIYQKLNIKSRGQLFNLIQSNIKE